MKKSNISKSTRLINSAYPTSRNQKYSNITLFNRREKERELSSNLKTQKTETSNFFNYKKSLPSITLRNLNKLKPNNSIYSKTTKITNSDLCQNTFYLTQNQNFSDFLYNKNDLSSFNLSDYGTKKKPFIANVKLLNYFEEKTKSLENVKKTKRKIDKKINQLNIKKSGLNDKIEKTREAILMQYTYNIKKERAIRLNENYENQMNTLDEIIKSLTVSQKLFHEQFYNKFGEYIKQLSIKRENEKLINSNLLEKELKLKGEISQINSKIQKITIDKNNIIRWIYFQILVKEKILNIPIHYKFIIEDQDDSFKLVYENFHRRETIKPNIEDKLHQSFHRKNSVKKQFEKKGISRRFTKFQQQIANNYNSFTNISPVEIERIKLYKIKPAFNSPNEFMEVIKKYEMENNNNLNLYNDLRLELRYLNNEKNELEKEKNNQINQINEIISCKINELNNIKNRFENLMKEKNNIKNNMYKNKKKFNNEKKRKAVFDFENNKIYHYKPNLEEKIKQVYLTCQELDLEKIISPEIFPKRKNNTKEEELIEFLSKIEFVLTYLIGKLSVYRNNSIYYDELKKIQSEIEKEHKIIKNKKQREQEILKIKRLKEQIEERNEKNYFIPRRKVNNYFEFVKKKSKKTHNQKHYFNDPNFEDFMYDIEKKRTLSQ